MSTLCLWYFIASVSVEKNLFFVCVYACLCVFAHRQIAQVTISQVRDLYLNLSGRWWQWSPSVWSTPLTPCQRSEKYGETQNKMAASKPVWEISCTSLPGVSPPTSTPTFPWDGPSSASLHGEGRAAGIKMAATLCPPPAPTRLWILSHTSTHMPTNTHSHTRQKKM